MLDKMNPASLTFIQCYAGYHSELPVTRELALNSLLQQRLLSLVSIKERIFHLVQLFISERSKDKIGKRKFIWKITLMFLIDFPVSCLKYLTEYLKPIRFLMDFVLENFNKMCDRKILI